ncbi:hypothetical protein ETAA8_51570 [Anatilimnocola aggregata]|uniref:Uncharacterized protein n=1 Tax=Anatilimnocola aggregata TaxID=2528021 RepID=A0A517YII8_9BACT|nr:hypothetical protein [Anatilimnocola aggregata]QDU30039.1 hypothetical protein ETAA8_51570 [Anatilimnocola aggregata]
MGDIKHPALLYLKGGLFVALGLLTVTAILVLHPSLQLAALLAIAIWSFCRAYYFAFYVIQHYIDPKFRYAGLWDFARYALKKRDSQ